jgi:hypothetical protein
MPMIDFIKNVALDQGNVEATGRTAIFIQKTESSSHDLE